MEIEKNANSLFTRRRGRVILNINSLGEQGCRSNKITFLPLQCGLGSNPNVDAICGLSLLLVLSLAPRGFYLGTPVFPSPQNPTHPNSNSIWNARTRFSNNSNNYNLQCTIYNFFFPCFDGGQVGVPNQSCAIFSFKHFLLFQ